MNFRLLFAFLLSFLFITTRAFAADVRINEMIVHPGTGNHEWLEFYNPGHIDLSGYLIDDDTDFSSDAGGSKIKSLAGIDNTSDHPVFELTSSMFNNDGDTVVLFSPDGGVVDQYHYVSDPGVDKSIGRSPDGSGDFSILISSTKGSANASVEPTKTPTPTKTPSPTHSPTPTHTPSSTPTKTTSGSQVTQSISSQSDTQFITPQATSEEIITPEVTIASLVASNTPTLKPMGVAKVEASRQEKSRFSFLPFLIGISFVIVGSGITFVLLRRKKIAYEGNTNQK